VNVLIKIGLIESASGALSGWLVVTGTQNPQVLTKLRQLFVLLAFDQAFAERRTYQAVPVLSFLTLSVGLAALAVIGWFS
jgi:hypothetical protein